MDDITGPSPSGSPRPIRPAEGLPSNRRCAATSRQYHVEIRPNLNESAFGLITDIWERAFQDVLWMQFSLILR